MKQETMMMMITRLLLLSNEYVIYQNNLKEMQVEDVGVLNSQHLAVVEYVDDLYAFYKRAEDLSFNYTDYMSEQADINGRMRAVLVNWLIEIHDDFKFMEETLLLTVNLIDRFLAIEQVQRTKLQLLGATAMLLACKYEEVRVPPPDHFVQIADNSFSREEMLRVERLMANKLQFDMSIPTPYVFMKRFLQAAESDEKTEFLAFYIIELSLVDYEMIKYRPSLLAAAASVFSAESALTGNQRWTMACQQASSYSEEQLMECAKLMVRLHQRAHQRALTGRLTGVYCKYNKPKFGNTTSYEPANFLLEDNSNNNDNNVKKDEKNGEAGDDDDDYKACYYQNEYVIYQNNIKEVAVSWRCSSRLFNHVLPLFRLSETEDWLANRFEIIIFEQ